MNSLASAVEEPQPLSSQELQTARPFETRRSSANPANRRAHRRLNAQEFDWLRTARLKYGPEVRVLDISAGGMSIETEHPLKPQSHIVIELAGTANGLVVPSLVLRSHVAALGDAVRYRSACSFKRPLQLSRLIPRLDRFSSDSTDFIRLDLALKHLLGRYAAIKQSVGAAPDQQRIAPEEIIAALESLIVKAASLRTDAGAHVLADIIAGVLPALKKREPAATVLQQVQLELRRMVPSLEVELSGAPLTPQADGAESIYFDIAGDGIPERVLNVQFPDDLVPDEYQLRVLQGGSYLIELLQGWNELIVTPGSQKDAAPREPLPPSAAPSPWSWQKVIARYLDGRVLKGYTNDFNALRPQLHMSEKPPAGESLMVPLTQLKALFFVRDFAGDPTYVAQKTFMTPIQGRKIEVTFVDGEALLGSTLGYRPEGHGFFVHPADGGGNNLRVFVSSGAVRHVRFL